MRLDLGSSDVEGYEGNDPDDADVDVEEQSVQNDHGSTHNWED